MNTAGKGFQKKSRVANFVRVLSKTNGDVLVYKFIKLYVYMVNYTNVPLPLKHLLKLSDYCIGICSTYYSQLAIFYDSMLLLVVLPVDICTS